MRKALLAIAASLLLAGLTAAPAHAGYRVADIGSDHWQYLTFAEARGSVKIAWGYTITSIPCWRMSNQEITCQSSNYEYYFSEYRSSLGCSCTARIELWRFDR